MPPRLRLPSVLRRSSWPLLRLCIAQACERFAFYAMLPLFAMYLHERHGLSESSALLLIGVFSALSYVGALPAGRLSDRRLGPTFSTLWGMLLLALGYGALAADRPVLLWPALALMILGHSFFKPNLHVLIGKLVEHDDDSRERAFLLHYAAANLGGFAGALCGEWARVRDGWGALFGWAAAATVVGLVVLTLAHCGRSRRNLPAAHAAGGGTSYGSTRARLHAVFLICGVATVFWLSAQQANISLPLFAARNTLLQLTIAGRRIDLGPGHFASLHCLLVLVLLPLMIRGSAWLSRRRSEPSTAIKMLWGYVSTAAAFALLAGAALLGGDVDRVSPLWLVGSYLLLSISELLLAPLGVSMVIRIAPPGKQAQAIGLWFVAMALGNVWAGAGGALWNGWPHHRYFALVALLSLGAAAVLLARLKLLERLTPHPERGALRPVAGERVRAAIGTAAGSSLSFQRMLSRFTLRFSHARLLGASIPLVVLPALVLLPWLPLPLRAVCAILSGLATLTLGSCLVARAIDAVSLSSGNGGLRPAAA